MTDSRYLVVYETMTPDEQERAYEFLRASGKLGKITDRDRAIAIIVLKEAQLFGTLGMIELALALARELADKPSGDVPDHDPNHRS